ncbi:hypothetical protein O4158_21120 [Gordonia amicalis]|uniref:hypothetical protein n=1 Tax=Gordonia amicalis TaxID=89053 RepID=UPI0022B2C186|nr:hypothetical protein [Gordonia amicalis]MCZ4581542.1 hypothetical protein [Gordonia amicalis]
MRSITWAAAATATIALALTGCGPSNPAGPGGISGGGGNANSYAGIVTSSEAGPVSNGQVLVGVGDDSHLPAPYLTIAGASQVTAECHGRKGQSPAAITVTTADGWKVQLTHGSQTITAENPNVPASLAQLTTDPETIQSDREYNEQFESASDYTTGLNWDRPSPGHVEVQINLEDVPPEWARLPEFKMYMHINCGA